MPKAYTYMEATSEEWLKFAENAEQTMRDIGVFDIAWKHFQHERDYYLRLAVQREQYDAKRASH